MDTSTYTHLCRAGHADLIEQLAPGGIVVVAQADRLGVATHDTLWIVIEAYKVLFGRDKAITAKVVDDLLDTGMYLPLKSGESLVAWAWEEGLLP
jgi:hypothetical protein